MILYDKLQEKLISIQAEFEATKGKFEILNYPETIEPGEHPLEQSEKQQGSQNVLLPRSSCMLFCKE